MRRLTITILLAVLAACSMGERPDKVAPQDLERRNSPVVLGQPNDQTKVGAAKICFWNDREFADDARVCDSDRTLECHNDKWIDVGAC